MSDEAAFKLTTPGDREVAMTRAFDAPRGAVFDCWTRPGLLKRWLTGPAGWSLAVCEVDLRVGGAYRFAWRSPDGVGMGVGGVYREVAPPERLVSTALFDLDWTGGETVGTVVLAEQGGRTTLANTVRYASRAARDGALATGMGHGVAESYARLAELLASSPIRGD